MKTLALVIFASLTFSQTSSACTDFSGYFRFAEAPWNGTIRIEQKGCSKISVVHSRKAAGRSVLTQNLKLDGKAYVGIENASVRANSNSTWYQKVSVENNRLVFRQYSGALKNCGKKYSFNNSRCHMITYVLSPESRGEDYAWVETGVWWNEGGKHITRRHVLSKTSDNFITAIAQR